MAPIHDFADRGDVAGVRRELAAGVSPDDNDSFLTDTPLHKASRFTAPAHVQIMSLLIENGANPNSRNYLGWSPLHLCVAGGNIDGAALILAAGASPSLKCDDGRAPLEYNPGSKRILPLLLKFGAPLPRSSHAGWMNQPLLYRERPDPKMKRYIAKVTVAGSWVEYEKGHTRRLVPVFEKIFPRPRLPHEIASHVVRFCFHTGDY